jgi:hypothetical protein
VCGDETVNCWGARAKKERSFGGRGTYATREAMVPLKMWVWITVGHLEGLLVSDLGAYLV